LGKVAIFQTENHAGLPIENQNKPDQELSGYQFCPAFQYLPLQGGSSKGLSKRVIFSFWTAQSGRKPQEKMLF
jgi:hypothetical protein